MASPAPPGSSSFYSSEGELATFPNPSFEWEETGHRVSPYQFHPSPPPQTLAHGLAAASLQTASASPTSPPPPHEPAPGFSFCPSDSELVSFYLRPRISGQPLPDAAKQFLHEADVYATDPASLVSGYLPGSARAKGESKNWYFFSLVKPKSAQDARKSRIVGGGKGSWKQERGNDVVGAEGHAVGRLEKFTYTPNPKEDKKPPEWLMREFSVDQQDGGQPRPVLCLCKIYQSPRFLKSASKNSASARKRKTPEDESLHASAPKKSNASMDESSAARRQLQFPPLLPPSNLPSPVPSPPPPAPNPVVEVEDDFWEQIREDPAFNCGWEELCDLSPCSLAAVAPTPLGSSHGSQCA
ncbi:NAC domain-containing protein 78 [Hordeum vulgare]|uniref:NAC domain-containing protein n=1 Tax=Hordeum vulgare subsp. vulgare TaxID=112509 RepID=A0A8I6XGY4_HORVV|nr:NAC domain-containing protein 72-like [Hordeum vulgare subsp. vulgare]KAE8790169.1 NAC domain-containing protein 78 [Hordeum vulgare]KAI5003458.1 hypothetical protein ZWY2020_030618 [Hordeum vulgare]